MEQLKEAAIKVLARMSAIRVGLTVFMVLWIVYMFRCLDKSDADGDDEYRHQRCYYRHAVLFGTQSLVYFMFQMWFWTLAMVIFLPVVTDMLPAQIGGKL